MDVLAGRKKTAIKAVGCAYSLQLAMGRLPLNGEKMRMRQFFSWNALVFARMDAATSLQVTAALAGVVARVVSMVLSLRMLELISQVVAPDCSKALQIRRA